LIAELSCSFIVAVPYYNGPWVATINLEQIVQPEKADAPKDVEF